MADDPAFEALIKHLRDSRGFDFSGYKRTSLSRRVDRRMQEVRVSGYEEYVDHLEMHPEEFTALFNTILINVTAFFRDDEPWEYLRTDVVPRLVEAAAHRPLRVWSAGCASGEEAYSLAIALAEEMGTDAFRDRVKIYATDVDDEALAQARAATYRTADLQGLPPDLVEKYFELLPDGRRLFRKEIRRSVIFGRNDLVQDAPISRIDLLVCRNTLMYFNAETQSRILRRLHFALAPDGVLFLGKAEMLLSHGQLFTPLDLKHRLFTKAPADPPRERTLLVGPLGSATSRDPDLLRLRQETLMASPVAQLAIDQDGRLALSNHAANALFGLGSSDLGRPFRDLEVSYRPAELRAAMQDAATARRPVWIRDVEWKRTAGPQWFDIQIVPLVHGDGPTLGATIVFTDMTRSRDLTRDLEYAHRQLETAYEQLQSSNEELETTNEELQSTVEELETTNEELQSTNEELETMNQELQSMNEELHSSNDQLRDRTVQLAELNDFMQAILTSLESAVVVVDRDLEVQVWNRLSEDLWGLRQEETVGKHLMALDTGFPFEALRTDLRRITGEPQAEAARVRVDAVNRRGKPLSLDVSMSPLISGHATDGHIGAIVFMVPITG